MRTKTLDKYPDYLIHDDGRVWSNKVKRFLTPTVAKRGGYRTFSLTDKDGHQSSIYARRLVALAFLGQSPKRGYMVGLKDGNEANLHYTNLEWRAKSTFANPKSGAEHFRSKLTSEQCQEIRERYPKERITYNQLAKEYGVYPGTIANIVRGVTRKEG